TVRDRNGHLMVGITNQPTQEVLPASATRWSYRGVDATLAFQLPQTGRAPSLLLHPSGIQQAARRLGSGGRPQPRPASLGDDRKALFMNWLEEHGPSVMKVARAYTLTSDECQDLAQEILLQAWRSLPKFGGRASAATWFYRVALHTAMNWHRQVKPRRARQ